MYMVECVFVLPSSTVGDGQQGRILSSPSLYSCVYWCSFCFYFVCPYVLGVHTLSWVPIPDLIQCMQIWLPLFLHGQLQHQSGHHHLRLSHSVIRSVLDHTQHLLRYIIADGEHTLINFDVQGTLLCIILSVVLVSCHSVVNKRFIALLFSQLLLQHVLTWDGALLKIMPVTLLFFSCSPAFSLCPGHVFPVWTVAALPKFLLLPADFLSICVSSRSDLCSQLHLCVPVLSAQQMRSLPQQCLSSRQLVSKMRKHTQPIRRVCRVSAVRRQKLVCLVLIQSQLLMWMAWKHIVLFLIVPKTVGRA